MFLRRPSIHKVSGHAGLRMVALEDQRPLTSQVTVGLVSLSKKGAVLLLDSPFIDGSHVLMDVHNITPKLAQVRPLGPEAQEGPALVGEVARFDRLEEDGQVRFLLEVAWTPAGQEARGQLLKQLQQAAKQPLAGEAS